MSVQLSKITSNSVIDQKLLKNIFKNFVHYFEHKAGYFAEEIFVKTRFMNLC